MCVGNAAPSQGNTCLKPDTCMRAGCAVRSPSAARCRCAHCCTFVPCSSHIALRGAKLAQSPSPTQHTLHGMLKWVYCAHTHTRTCCSCPERCPRTLLLVSACVAELLLVHLIALQVHLDHLQDREGFACSRIRRLSAALCIQRDIHACDIHACCHGSPA
jgi:hypothetical protein